MSNQELTPFQVSDLERLLCVRLGIAPAYQARHEYWDHAGNPCDCVCGAKYADSRPRGEKCPARCDSYPRLSTMGEGMLTLMEALRAQGHSWVVEGDGFGLCRGKVQPEGWHHAILGERADSAPLALALAAAAALGIEVPEMTNEQREYNARIKELRDALRLLTTCDTCSGTGLMTTDCYACLGESRGCPDCNDTNRVKDTCAACDGAGIYCNFLCTPEVRELVERLHKAERESQKKEQVPA